jgi:DNA modification methylase
MTTILEGDCMLLLPTLPEKSVDTIITSPPYFQQRDYEMATQIGSEETVEEYILIMKKWARECKRVLKDTGSMFVNIGDKYEKKGLQMIPERVCLAILDEGWVLRNKIVWYKPNHMPSSVKDRFCSTWEPVYFFTKDSNKYYSQEYYSNLDCLRETPQTKQKHPFPKTVSVEEYPEWEEKIKEYNESKSSNGKFKKAGKNNGSSPGARQQKGISYSRLRKHDLTNETEIEIHTYLKTMAKEKKMTSKKLDELFQYKSKAGHWLRIDHGRSLPSVSDYRRLKEVIGLDDRYDCVLTEEHYVLQSVTNNEKGKSPEDLWSIPLTHEKGVEHYAVFPIELPLKIISSFCPPGGVVLDPFAGSGTTGLAAKQYGVSFILMELNPDYVHVMKTRLDIQ